MELALEWLESQRAVMYDPTKADWFLQYTDGHGNKNGTIYSEPNEWGDQFFWDYQPTSFAADCRVRLSFCRARRGMPRSCTSASSQPGQPR